MEKSLVYLRGPDGTAVQAELWDDISTEHVALWTGSWKPEIDRLRLRLGQDEVAREKWPQDLHWDWSEKADATRSVLAYQRFALQATLLGIRNSFVNQPVEVAAMRAAFASWLGIPGRRPDLVVRFGYASPMPRSLRRRVTDIIV